MFDRTFKHFSASPEELIKNKFQDTFFFNKLGTLGNLLYLCTREEPPSPFIFDSNRASEPIEITAKFNGGLRYAPQKTLIMIEKKCPQCGEPMAKSSSRVESGEYIEVYVCSNLNCGNVWHYKTKI